MTALRMNPITGVRRADPEPPWIGPLHFVINTGRVPLPSDCRCAHVHPFPKEVCVEPGCGCTKHRARVAA